MNKKTMVKVERNGREYTLTDGSWQISKRAVPDITLSEMVNCDGFELIEYSRRMVCGTTKQLLINLKGDDGAISTAEKTFELYSGVRSLDTAERVTYSDCESDVSLVQRNDNKPYSPDSEDLVQEYVLALLESERDGASEDDARKRANKAVTSYIYGSKHVKQSGDKIDVCKLGKQYKAPILTEKQLERFTKFVLNLDESLTEKQRELLHLLVDFVGGWAYVPESESGNVINVTSIANELGVSKQAVSKRLKVLRKKALELYPDGFSLSESERDGASEDDKQKVKSAE